MQELKALQKELHFRYTDLCGTSQVRCRHNTALHLTVTVLILQCM